MRKIRVCDKQGRTIKVEVVKTSFEVQEIACKYEYWEWM